MELNLLPGILEQLTGEVPLLRPSIYIVPFRPYFLCLFSGPPAGTARSIHAVNAQTVPDAVRTQLGNRPGKISLFSFV